MKQTRLMSLIEAVANVLVGYGVAVIAQILVFPGFGLHTTLAQNLKMGLVFSEVSIIRSFALRRIFDSVAGWQKKGPTEVGPRSKFKELRQSSQATKGSLINICQI